MYIGNSPPSVVLDNTSFQGWRFTVDWARGSSTSVSECCKQTRAKADQLAPDGRSATFYSVQYLQPKATIKRASFH
jgi:hypothetical protein